jgi:hypothetical protein
MTFAGIGALALFGATLFRVRLRDQVALDAVRADLLDAVRETVQPAHAHVWLRQ